MRAIPTKYNGDQYRSRLEAKWAVFFNEWDIYTFYEYQAYHLDGPDMNYWPDFWLPEWKLHLEVKGDPEQVTNWYNRSRWFALAKESQQRVLVVTDIRPGSMARMYFPHPVFTPEAAKELGDDIISHEISGRLWFGDLSKSGERVIVLHVYAPELFGMPIPWSLSEVGAIWDSPEWKEFLSRTEGKDLLYLSANIVKAPNRYALIFLKPDPGFPCAYTKVDYSVLKQLGLLYHAPRDSLLYCLNGERLAGDRFSCTEDYYSMARNYKFSGDC